MNLREIEDSQRVRWLALGLGVLTLALFAPTWGQQMLYWDDSVNVLENPLVLAPGLTGLKKIFTSIFSTDYYPVTYLSLAFDHWLWRGNFAGYHVTQTVLHAINAGLVLLLVWRWTKNVAVAVVVAVWFAWHPVQVESVAWVAERKNLLGTGFILLAWLAYLREWRLAALGLFVLATLSHALVIVMPVMLVLYEVCVRKTGWREAVGRTWLFFVPAGFAALMRVLGHGDSGQLAGNFPSAWAGILTMINVMGEYLTTLTWPVRLNNYYVERIVHNLADAGLWIGLGWAAVWGLAIWRSGVYRRWVVFALGWFVLALLPVMQLVPHPTLRADRYLYSAMIGPLLVVALVLSDRPRLLGIAGVVGAIWFAGLTSMRIPDWRDGRTLWADSVAKNPRSAMAHYSLAGCLIGEKDWANAEIHARQAVEFNDGFADAQERLGSVLLVQGRGREAREHLVRALELNPKLVEARRNLELLGSVPASR